MALPSPPLFRSLLGFSLPFYAPDRGFPDPPSYGISPLRTNRIFLPVLLRPSLRPIPFVLLPILLCSFLSSPDGGTKTLFVLDALVG
jgi:hypothetical protein